MAKENKKKRRKKREKDTPSKDDSPKSPEKKVNLKPSSTTEAKDDNSSPKPPEKNDKSTKIRNNNDQKNQTPKKPDKVNIIQTKQKRKLSERKELYDRLPKVDENGISYTKIQLRRMSRRLKRGLPPVPTEEEERERIKMRKKEEREEELELAGMFYSKEDGEVREEEEEESDDDDDEEESGGEEEEVGKEDMNDDDNEDNKNVQKNEPSQQKKRHTKQDDRSNKLGYPPPSEKKVFVSGLPFDATRQSVERFFRKEGGKDCVVTNCKLLTFSDSKRCRGQGFVTFETEEGAKKALELSGKTLEMLGVNDRKERKKKRNRAELFGRTKVLKLKVSKVLNRNVTKKRKHSGD